ncbi:MAG TPA: serine/threonine-protein kinase, partial [Nannocystaceae bacterium]|nr:serine/threonine-protein kinase [Nannocystaceae bacterium]
MSEPRRPTDAPSQSSAHADTVERVDDDFVDTAHVRNLVQARLFGATIEPVRIGRFPILRTIGKGAMGAVYAAYDNQLDRKIALKLLHAGTSDDDEVRRGRMLREAKALARLSHPGVVHVYEVGEHEGRVYLAMEFVEGADVRKWSREAERSITDVLEIFAQAGRGLAAAHAAGLVHRDVKPDNIVVGTDGRARMIDFGLAVEHDDAEHVADDDGEPQPLPLDRWTQTRGIVGTPAYMAAEQLAGAAADARSDQFGFAVALFEALYGQRPFAGASLPALADAVARGQLEVPTGR